MLFARRDSIYKKYGLDVYDDRRNAFKYQGHSPVICHPPCARWGKYATKGGNLVGDDYGAFDFCLRTVNMWGGIIEHPAHSKAWQFHDIPKPPVEGGWIPVGPEAWTCHVEQGNYGHRAPKATWLYLYGHQPWSLKWGPSGAIGRITKMRRKEREATPEHFARILIGMVTT